MRSEPIRVTLSSRTVTDIKRLVDIGAYRTCSDFVETACRLLLNKEAQL